MTTFDKDLKKLEKEWMDDEFPILAIGAVISGILSSFLLGLTFDYGSFTFWEIVMVVFSLIGFGVYMGRQVVDFLFLYLLLSFKGNYQTLDEKQDISYRLTKHISRAVYLLSYGTLLYFAHTSIHLSWFIPLICSLFLLPIIYRILANNNKTKVEEKLKKNPIKRVSQDGEIDLTHLPFIYEDIEKHSFCNETIKETYKQVQHLLDYVTLRVSYIDDIENVHILKRMGEEDLPRLLNDYEKLEKGLQKEYEKKTLHYLDLFKAKLMEFKKNIEEKKSQQIHATFSLLDERYQK